MADRPRLLYVVVQDEKPENTEMCGRPRTCSFRYTRPLLQSTLQLIGCKPRHSFKISKRVFDVLRNETPLKIPQHMRISSLDLTRHLSDSEINSNKEYCYVDIKRAFQDCELQLNQRRKELLVVQKQGATIIVNRKDFLDVICDAMSMYRYLGHHQRADLLLACRIKEKKTSMTILLCGTSGCGKSTLSTLLASRLGITTVVSTDSIRHMMRSFVDENDNPLLWASTYHAGEYLDPIAVAEAKAKKKAKKMSVVLPNHSVEAHFDIVQAFVASSDVGKETRPKEHFGEHCEACVNSERGIKGKVVAKHESNCCSQGSGMVVSSRTMAVQGYKAQSEMVIDSLDRLITSWEQKNESVVVEGVHLSLNFVMELMKKHPSIIPFMIYISNEGKHLERFAVRAKYMTLEPTKNKYVKYIRNIRAIQEYLGKEADKHVIPKVNNTNVDRSVAAIHATIFSCLRRREGGEPLYDQTTNTVKVVDEEYRNHSAANVLGSKGMFQLLQRRGSSRQLMALVNNDGSVAEAWPFESVVVSGKATSSSGNNNGYGYSLSGLLDEGPVNLQFGKFGLSAWSTDAGGTSHSSSIDGSSSRGEGVEYNSSHYSSCPNSPRPGDGAEKEWMTDNIVSESDEEPEEVPDADSDEDLDASNKQPEEEMEGSVDDQSIRSDEDDEELVAAVDDNIYSPGNSEECRTETIEYIGTLALTPSSQGAVELRDKWCKRSNHVQVQCLRRDMKENVGGFFLSKGEPHSEHKFGNQIKAANKQANVLFSHSERILHNRSKSMPFL